jgi:O-antigen ligase
MSQTAFTNEFGFVPAEANLARRSKLTAATLRLTDQILFGGLLCVTLFVAIPYGTVEPWWTSVYECAIFLLAGIWILKGFVGGNWEMPDVNLLAPMAALALFAYAQTLPWPGVGTGSGLPRASMAISSDPFETRLTSLKFLAFTFNGALLLSLVSTKRRLHLLIYAVIGVAAVSALFGIARHSLQTHEVGFILPYLRKESGFGQFVNKNHFAFMMEMAIGLATGLMLAGGVRRERLLIYISAVLLMWTGLVMTSSRGGLLSMFAQVGFLFAIFFLWRLFGSSIVGTAGFRQAMGMRTHWQRGIKRAAALLCLLAAIAVSAVWLGGDLLVTRLGSLSGEIQSEEQDPHAGVRRREVWRATWNLIKEHPVSGSGFGAYAVAITRFHEASGKWTPEAAHNDYLELLASGGIAGAGILIWFTVILIKRLRRRLCSPDRFLRAASLGAMTGIFGVLAHNVVDFGLHVTSNSVILIALVVIGTKYFSSAHETSSESHARTRSDEGLLTG